VGVPVAEPGVGVPLCVGVSLAVGESLEVGVAVAEPAVREALAVGDAVTEGVAVVEPAVREALAVGEKLDVRVAVAEPGVGVPLSVGDAVLLGVTAKAGILMAEINAAKKKPRIAAFITASVTASPKTRVLQLLEGMKPSFIPKLSGTKKIYKL
jgi:hypothetical protein